MTQQEWENATEEERNAEIDRCKDPVYYYNTYWLKSDGTKPAEITYEHYNNMVSYYNKNNRLQ